MLRLFSPVFAPVLGLIVVGAVSSASAQEVSEVTIQPPEPSVQRQMVTAHAIEYAPGALSEVTVGPGTSSSSSQAVVVAGTEPYPGESTVSEVTIQPGKVTPAPRARTSVATSGSQPDAEEQPAAIISVP